MPAIRIVAGLAVALALNAVAVCQAADAPVPPPASSEKSTPEAQPSVLPPAPDAAAVQPAAPPPVASTPPAPVAKPPSVTVIDAFDAKGILGRDVRSPASENMGRIADVIVDRAGQVRGAVIDFGGFLGVGSRKIVVDWGALHFWNVADKTASITLDLTREQVRAAPEYKDDQPIVVLGASGTLTPLRFPPLTMQER
ncbi:PRC-barrel domain-containing protein [Tardiphaga sp. 42S5]|uniref:PRC-barrel domain-containing protein n=1 Tax=Tardiphaga sp. 42S5 TaxID=1404799 RepID=UPI002A5A06CD|nr:PRC-barrel domain-containing protein [Tardiphaga sp. 42S5]WPO42622.1 PRC-barrel domain-containing protein [Tardiphaga sp. 42S5]